MKDFRQCSMDSPVGKVSVAVTDRGVAEVVLGDSGSGIRDSAPPGAMGPMDACLSQIREYFAGERKRFDLPLDLSGTDFQRRVWDAMRKIPYGETRSYGEIASMVGSPKAARAVGAAAHGNRLPLLVPCHRVVGADGSLVGFGAGLGLKRWLLDFEALPTNKQDWLKGPVRSWRVP